MLKKQICTLLFVSLAQIGSLYCQNYFVSNLYNNLVFTNPSLSAFNDFTLIQLNYRNQWPVDGVYNTYGASFFHSAEDLNSNLGGIFYYDRQLSGAFSNTSIGINYAYKLRTSRRNHLIFGISGLFSIQQLNYSRLTFESPLVSTQENQIRNYPIFNSGIAYMIRDEHAIGVSVNNIYPFVSNPTEERALNVSYIGHIEVRGYNLPLTFIEPVANIKVSTNKIESLVGCNFGFYNFKSGILVNQSNFKLNAISILLGISFENYEFIYTYDLNLSTGITINPKMAAHEVTFLRKFQYKGRRKRRGAIKCPDI